MNRGDAEGGVKQQVFAGSRSQTTHVAVPFRCTCGALTQVSVLRSVDAKDTDLVERCLDAKDSGPCAVVCGVCHKSTQLARSFTYHDGTTGFFALVMDPAIGHRELSERICLLEEFAQEQAFIPDYVLNFVVVYGSDGLRSHLIKDESNSERVAQELAKVRDHERRLKERDDELQRVFRELEVSDEALKERESQLNQRARALDRRTGELEKKALALETLEETLRASGVSVPREDVTDVLTSADILTSAPDPNALGSGTVPSQVFASGTSKTDLPTSPDVGLKAMIGEESVDEAAWRHSDERTFKCLDKRTAQDPGRVRLLAAVASGALEDVVGGELRALLQLHRLPTYPLIVLSLGGQGGKDSTIPFYFDVGLKEDKAILKVLASSFRVQLEVFDETRRPVEAKQLEAPLAANVAYVMAAALEAFDGLDPSTRSFGEAVRAFESPSYDRLGRAHPLAQRFRESLVEPLDDPSSVVAAVADCEELSTPEGQDYLVAIRSYPLPLWRERLRAVVSQALKMGLWLGPALATVAVSEEFARSRRELLLMTRRAFQSFLQDNKEALSEAAVQANWRALDRELDALSATLPGVERRFLEGEERTGGATKMRHSRDVGRLIAQLGQGETRLAAIGELCRSHLVMRLGASEMQEIFHSLTLLSETEAARAFALVTHLGRHSAQRLLALLSCGAGHLRHGAALALCTLNDEEGIESVCELLMTDDGALWPELANALGEVGAAAVMPLVARIAEYGSKGRERGAWALGYIALRDDPAPVELLRSGQNEEVAESANQALTLARKIQDGQLAPPRSEEAASFSNAYYAALSSPNSMITGEESGPEMLLEESDLLVADDLDVRPDTVS